jgi:tRNA (guanine-N7-)-methyltransferase
LETIKPPLIVPEDRASRQSPAGDRPPTLIHRLASITGRLSIEELFVRAQPLEVELGSGDGSFILNYAAHWPERNFLGVERLLGRLRKIDRKGTRAGLTNLRLIRIEASYLLEYLLPDESAHGLHVYFPDPWPKLKHRRHRLINPRFTELARRVLAPGGTVYLRTDDVDYFGQMTEVFAASPSFRSESTPAALLDIVTDFERDFLARGIPTRRDAFRRL